MGFISMTSGEQVFSLGRWQDNQNPVRTDEDNLLRFHRSLKSREMIKSN